MLNRMKHILSMLGCAMLVGFVATTAAGQDLDVIAQARTEQGVRFASTSYIVDIQDFCEDLAEAVSCGDVEFIFTNKADNQSFELNGRSMNHRDETPSLFGYTASQLDTTYIVLIQDQKFLIIRNGEVTLEEDGIFTPQ